MTLVRIVPRLNEYPTKLVRDLRARGFAVETQYARQQQASAHLEIKLEQYSYEGICKDLAEIVAGNDIVILAGTENEQRKIRSIGMVLLTPESELHTARKTIVPAQLNELYLALLRGRLRSKRTLVLQSTRDAVCVVFRYLGKQFYALAEKVKRLAIPGVSGVAHWMNPLKRRWDARASSRITAKSEPDLVPSMFGLSVPEASDATLSAQAQESAGLPPEPKLALWSSRNWRPISVGAVVAAIACFLWLFDFSHPAASADQSSQIKPVASGVTQAFPVSHTQKDDKVILPRTPGRIDAVAVAGDDDSQEVVVRHFTDSSSKTSQPDDGIKRVVVVN